jgi:hypothetical protein
LANTWITDLRHFLDERGAIAPLSGPGRKLAEHLAAIVAAVTAATEAGPITTVRCRRRPGRRPCPGEIEAEIDAETMDILWLCPVCGDNGVVHHWQGTLWDCRERRTAS